MNTSTYAITNVRIVTPFRIVDMGTIVIRGKQIVNMGRVTDVNVGSDITVYDLKGKTVAPGFIDLLVHGGGGKGFADDSDESIRTISEFFFSNGTTGMLASLFSKRIDLL